MEPTIALREAMQSADWDVLRLSRAIDVRDGVIYKWLRGQAVPNGATMLRLMRTLPGFAERLGFQHTARAA